jgi:LysM repeat protein
VYIVKAGDSLWEIARRFGISMNELALANGINDPSQISEGAQLVIPGLVGLQGILDTKIIPYGEGLGSLSRQYKIPQEMLARLNRLTSPLELYAGSDLVLPVSDDSIPGFSRAILAPEQSLLELAVLEGTNPWALVRDNALPGTWGALPGDTLLLQDGRNGGPGALPGEIITVEVDTLPLLQGKTSAVKLESLEELSLSGTLMGHDLHFIQDQRGEYVALLGVHAMVEPGIYPMTLEGELFDGTPFAFSQMIPVVAVDYPYDRPLTVDPATIDPAVTRPEDAQWAALTEPVTTHRMWDGIFAIPSPLPAEYCLETNDCWSSRFGNRRSYNGSAYDYFHTGLDIVGGSGTEIYAPANCNLRTGYGSSRLCWTINGAWKRHRNRSWVGGLYGIYAPVRNYG